MQDDVIAFVRNSSPVVLDGLIAISSGASTLIPGLYALVLALKAIAAALDMYTTTQVSSLVHVIHSSVSTSIVTPMQCML